MKHAVRLSLLGLLVIVGSCGRTASMAPRVPPSAPAFSAPTASRGTGDSYRVEGEFAWPDGFHATLVVYNRFPGTNQSSVGGDYYSISNYGALHVTVDGKAVVIPWSDVKAIETAGRAGGGQQTVRVTKRSGEQIQGTAARLEIEGYWDGMTVTAKGWVSASNFHRDDFVKPPDKGMSACYAAGTCTASIDWGTWQFYTRNGEVLTGLLDGAFGLDPGNGGAVTPGGQSIPVGQFPDKVLFSDLQAKGYDNGRFVIPVSPSFTVRKLGFTGVRQSRIDLELKNGEPGQLKLSPKQTSEIASNGFLTWASFGIYPVRCLVRIRSLDRMELVSSAAKSGVGQPVVQGGRGWRISRRDGQDVSAESVHGHQMQSVPG